MREWIQGLTEQIKQTRCLQREEAERLLALEPQDLHHLLYGATELRQYFRGNNVKTCSIVNAKSGRCGENCRFCAQSAHFNTHIDTYPLMSCDEILSHVEKEEGHSMRFGIVTAGKSLNQRELAEVVQAVEGFSRRGLTQLPCASLGVLPGQNFEALKRAGLIRFHHNLETSRKYYPNICTTHQYDERVDTIKAAKAAGLEICVGGIFGLGESLADRLDLLYEVAELNPHSVPINFLVAIPGTPLEEQELITLWEAVKIIATARFVMPDKDIKVGAGRLEVFKDAQHLVFLAGANGMIVGDLLTVKGRSLEDDLAVIRDLGLEMSA